MAEIYLKAFWVLIWLGTEADGSNEIIEAINTSIISTHQELKVERLLGRPYWNRLWILQEILMGQAILVLCGNKSFHWENLENLFIPRDTRVDFGGLDRQLWKHPLNIRDVVLSLIEEKASFKGADGRLSYMLESFAGLQCEDVRDKVYGLLSLVRSSRVIPVDYSKTSTEVFFNAIRRIVKDESFMAIDSHFDVGQRLRDRMRLVDISDTEISEFMEKELGEVMKESELQQNMGDSDDQDMLLAAHNGDEVVIEQLLEKGIYQLYLDGKDSNGRSPLSWAAAKGNKASVKLLLEGAADINSEDNYGQTPLTRAALYGHEAVVKLLIDEGALLESKDMDFGWTPLSWAAKLGNETVVMLLLEKGAHPEAKDSTDRTPLSWAADNGHEAVVKQLLEKGAHPETKDNAGRTPLSRAAEKGYETIVQLLESS
jgi:hypothetical protein